MNGSRVERFDLVILICIANVITLCKPRLTYLTYIPRPRTTTNDRRITIDNPVLQPYAYCASAAAWQMIMSERSLCCSHAKHPFRVDNANRIHQHYCPSQRPPSANAASSKRHRWRTHTQTHAHMQPNDTHTLRLRHGFARSCASKRPNVSDIYGRIFYICEHQKCRREAA